MQGEVLGMSGKVQELQINRFHRFVFNLKARFEYIGEGWESVPFQGRVEMMWN